MPESNVLLDLDVRETQRHGVIVKSEQHPDGRFYGFRQRDELSLTEVHAVSAWADKISKTRDKPFQKLSTHEAKNYEHALEGTVRLALPDLEDDVLSKMHDLKRVRVAEAWYDLYFRTTDDAGSDVPPSTGGS